MAVRPLLALLLTGWIAAMPAHRPMRVCFCAHSKERPCHHSAPRRAMHHRHARATGIAENETHAPAGCRCFTLSPSGNLAPLAAPPVSCTADEATAPHGMAVPGAVASLRGTPPPLARGAGSPTFLRLHVLLV